MPAWRSHRRCALPTKKNRTIIALEWLWRWAVTKTLQRVKGNHNIIRKWHLPWHPLRITLGQKDLHLMRKESFRGSQQSPSKSQTPYYFLMKKAEALPGWKPTLRAVEQKGPSVLSRQRVYFTIVTSFISALVSQCHFETPPTQGPMMQLGSCQKLNFCPNTIL